MAHNLSTFIDEKGEVRHCCLSLRENPWHGLGQIIDTPATAATALQLAGLDWSALQSDLKTDPSGIPIPNHKAIVRSDTNTVLGVVGKDYMPLQNREVFDLLGNISSGSDSVIETAGALGNGETVWAMIRLDKFSLAIGDDVSRSYLLATNNHAGQKTFNLLPTTVRVVCQNTLRMAMTNRKGRSSLTNGYTVRHTSGMKTALSDIASAYSRFLQAHSDTKQVTVALAGAPVKNEATLRQYYLAVFPEMSQEEQATQRAREIASRRMIALLDLYSGKTCQVRGTAGSWYAALSSVTEFVDHDRTTRSRSQGTLQSRLVSATFGSGAEVKDRAWDQALAFAGLQ